MHEVSGYQVGRPDVASARRIISRALERGVNYLDTAYLYPGNEEVVGAVLDELGARDVFARNQASRMRLVSGPKISIAF